MKPISIGNQSFSSIREENCFYIDKTAFIQEWWESRDTVTLITRPRRFGKTLNMSMLECFFSNQYENRGDLFEGLYIWENEECREQYRKLQGTYPVLFLSFASIKENNFADAYIKICELITGLYDKNQFLLNEDLLTDAEKRQFRSVAIDMAKTTATSAIHNLSKYLSRYYGRPVIILLDEYDTPMQEAYVGDYWDDMAGFIRVLFNATFKTNPYLHRAVMTGITRVTKESIFSDLNNLSIVTTTTEQYETAFGFTQQEVSDALALYHMEGEEEKLKNWYDGFTFGRYTDIYNPWSIINFLKRRKYDSYWANTSSNALISNLIQHGSAKIKKDMETLLQGGVLSAIIDEQIVFNQLNYDEDAVWSLMLASGYLKAIHLNTLEDGEIEYELAPTNHEVVLMFKKMVRQWFKPAGEAYNDFIKALLMNDKKIMNRFMNTIALNTISYFDSGNQASEQTEPERFYHGFVLGLLVDLAGKYHIRSNRESGFGRYDIMLEPLSPDDNAYVLEFKVFDPDDDEKTLEDTVQAALKQIDDKQYDTDLHARGIPSERIYHYGFAFKGKKVLIG